MLYQGSHTLGYKNFQDFPGLQKHFSRTLIYASDETYSSYYGVWGGALADRDFFSYIHIKSEPIFVNFGICTCITVSDSYITA